jgi:hypothetical protein
MANPSLADLESLYLLNRQIHDMFYKQCKIIQCINPSAVPHLPCLIAFDKLFSLGNERQVSFKLSTSAPSLSVHHADHARTSSRACSTACSPNSWVNSGTRAQHVISQPLAAPLLYKPRCPRSLLPFFRRYVGPTRSTKVAACEESSFAISAVADQMSPSLR